MEPWKQVIFYDFDKNMDKSLLIDIITTCQEYGVVVRAVVFDMGNHTLIKNLKVLKEGTSYFMNPTFQDQKILLFPDAPHCLKRLRDHTLDYGIRFPDGEGGYDDLTKATFENLLRQDQNELKICPKFTRTHVEVNGSARQKVRLAAQLFSETTAKALSFLDDELENVSEKIIIFDSWLDASNSRNLDEVKPLRRPFGYCETFQIQALENMRSEMEEMRYCNSKSATKKTFSKRNSN